MSPSMTRLAPWLTAVTTTALIATPLARADPRRGARHAAAVQIATADEVRPPNLIVNGGFELPALDDGTWNVFQEIRGWQTAAGPGIEIQRGVAGSPLTGAQHVELDSHASSAMFQILDTEPGHRYMLRYWASPRPGTTADNNRLVVRWDDDIVDRFEPTTVAADTTWVMHEVVLTAHHRETRVGFADASVSDGLGAYLDEVSVVDVTVR
jgi:hypothetical protein